MATVNFSVPEDVKEAFDVTFRDQNKSAVIAALMRRAVEEAQLVKRRRKIFQSLNAARDSRGSASDAEIRRTRTQGRS